MGKTEKQYAVYYAGVPIEYTGYLKSVQAVRTFLKRRYSETKGMTFRAVYPKAETKVYTV